VAESTGLLNRRTWKHHCDWLFFWSWHNPDTFCLFTLDAL